MINDEAFASLRSAAQQIHSCEPVSWSPCASNFWVLCLAEVHADRADTADRAGTQMQSNFGIQFSFCCMYLLPKAVRALRAQQVGQVIFLQGKAPWVTWGSASGMPARHLGR